MNLPRRNSEQGAALVLVLILLAAVVIGSVVVGVLFKRQLDRQRSEATKAQLVTAWRGLFGDPVRSTGTLVRRKPGNMRLDFFFNPTTASCTPPFAGTPTDLKAMTTLSSVATLDPLQSALGSFAGALPVGTNLERNIKAWNGPYWQGSVDHLNRPVDAWGRPFQLRYITTGTPGWQVYSLGANGADNTGNSGTPAGDDLAYPIPPATLPNLTSAASTYSVSLTVILDKTTPGNVNVLVYVTDALLGDVQMAPLTTVQMNSGAKHGPYSWGPLAVSINASTGTANIKVVDSPSSTNLVNKPFAIPSGASYSLTITSPDY